MELLKPEINLDAEVAAIADYISQKWSPIANLTELVQEIRTAAVHAGRAWIDALEISSCALKLVQDRKAVLAAAHGDELASDATLYDAVIQTLKQVSIDSDRVRAAGLALDGPWDYSKRVRGLALRLGHVYPELKAARPLGWDALAQGYMDFDGQAEYDKRPDQAMFKGSLVVAEYRAPDFVPRTALPYVMYDEVCQGRLAYEVLVGAIFSQFLGIMEYLNTLAVKEALRAISNLAVPDLVFETSIPGKGKIVLAFSSQSVSIKSKGDYLTAMQKRKAFEALPDEEKAARKASNQESISKFLESLRDPVEQKKADEREAMKVAKLNALMSGLFQA